MEYSSVEQMVVNNSETKTDVPSWYNDYVGKLLNSQKDLAQEVKDVSEMKYEDLSKHIGGRIDELPYEVLGTLLKEGSDDENVASMLREKREEYVKTHPEAYKGVLGASEGIIMHDGRVISQKDLASASESEKRAIFVGSTCFHYNSGTPGMDSNPKDRW